MIWLSKAKKIYKKYSEFEISTTNIITISSKFKESCNHLKFEN